MTFVSSISFNMLGHYLTVFTPQSPSLNIAVSLLVENHNKVCGYDFLVNWAIVNLFCDLSDRSCYSFGNFLPNYCDCLFHRSPVRTAIVLKKYFTSSHCMIYILSLAWRCVKSGAISNANIQGTTTISTNFFLKKIGYITSISQYFANKTR